MDRIEARELRAAQLERAQARKAAAAVPVPAGGGTDYHWIITVQTSGAGTFSFTTAFGTYTVLEPTTRAALFRWALSQISAQVGAAEFTVVFFDLAPNAITPGMAS